MDAAFIWGALLSPILLVLPPLRRFGFVATTTTLSGIMLFHMFGSVSLVEYLGIPVQPRYLGPAAVLMLLVIASAAATFVTLIGARPLRIFASIAFAGLAVVASIDTLRAASTQAGRIYHAVVYQETRAAIARFAPPFSNVPLYAGPKISTMTLDYGPIPGIEPASRLKAAVDDSETKRFMLLMEIAENDPITAGVVPPTGFVVTKLSPATHGLLVWADRASAIKAGLGFADPTSLRPPGRIVIYEVERMTDSRSAP